MYAGTSPSMCVCVCTCVVNMTARTLAHSLRFFPLHGTHCGRKCVAKNVFLSHFANLDIKRKCLQTGLEPRTRTQTAINHPVTSHDRHFIRIFRIVGFHSLAVHFVFLRLGRICLCAGLNFLCSTLGRCRHFRDYTR